MQATNPITDGALRLVREEACWTLTLARPGKANALTAGMMQALARAVAQAGEARPLPVLLLRSDTPRAFCAGADIAEFGAGPECLERQERGLAAMITALSASAAPVIAVARGRASGAGAILLALADVVIAADDLVIAAPEIRFGMYPVIVEAVLQSRLSPALAGQLCASGRDLGAMAARDLGLVTEVLPGADFDSRAAERVDYYLARAVGLGMARRARVSAEPARQLLQRLPQVAPLMAANYEDAGVRARIAGYLAQLRAARADGVDAGEPAR